LFQKASGVISTDNMNVKSISSPNFYQSCMRALSIYKILKPSYFM